MSQRLKLATTAKASTAAMSPSANQTSMDNRTAELVELPSLLSVVCRGFVAVVENLLKSNRSVVNLAD